MMALHHFDKLHLQHIQVARKDKLSKDNLTIVLLGYVFKTIIVTNRARMQLAG